MVVGGPNAGGNHSGSPDPERNLVTEASEPAGDVRRILMLVPHEPSLDPRVGWTIDLCRRIARTDVLALVWTDARPTVEFDGIVAIERVNAMTAASRLVVKASAALSRLDRCEPAREFWRRSGKPPEPAGPSVTLRHHVGAASRLVAAWGYYAILLSALYRRARAVSVRPRVIVAHDLYALIPAVVLKRRWGSSLLYDSHEYFPEADLLAPKWQKRLIRALERRFIRHADVVVTVSPQLAEELRRTYNLSRVLSVPNAEPRRGLPPPPRLDAATPPLRFLLQGQASEGRGFEELFDAWRAVDKSIAILLVRCPEHDYVARLRDRYADLAETGQLQWLDPVTEDELVLAASEADVGVIPYVGPSLNHLYASPNKLSHYMNAGLAILSSDLPYIASVLRRFDCGVTYRPEDPASLLSAVSGLAGDPAQLRTMRENARVASSMEFNWETVSGPYEEAIAELYGIQ
jgi:glycosyltransferase involved in cell wall biosynthesis